MNNDLNLLDDEEENERRLLLEALGKQLIECCKNGKLEEMKKCIEDGADTAVCDDKKWNCLDWSSYYGYHDIIEFMLEKKLNNDYKERANSVIEKTDKLFEQFRINNFRISTPLHWASYNGHTTAVSILISNGYLISDKDEDGNSALHLSASQGHLPVVELLLSVGSDIHLKNHYGLTPLDLSTKASVRKLLKSIMDQKVCAGCKAVFDIEIWPLLCSSCSQGFCSNCSTLKYKHIKKGSPIIHLTRYCDSCSKEISYWEELVQKNSSFESKQIDDSDVPLLYDALSTATNKNVDASVVDKGEREYNNLIASLSLQKLMDSINSQRPIKLTSIIDNLREEINKYKCTLTNQIIKLKAEQLLQSIILEKQIVGNMELCFKIECATSENNKDINRLKEFLDKSVENNIDPNTYDKANKLYNKMVNEVKMVHATYIPEAIPQDPPPEAPGKKKKKKVEVVILYHYKMEDGTEINTLLECLRIRVATLKETVEDSEKYQIFPPLLEKGKKMLEEISAQLNVEEEIETKRLEAEEAKRKKLARRKGKNKK